MRISGATQKLFVEFSAQKKMFLAGAAFTEMLQCF
jgi:hypothetical protein